MQHEEEMIIDQDEILSPAWSRFYRKFLILLSFETLTEQIVTVNDPHTASYYVLLTDS